MDFKFKFLQNNSGLRHKPKPGIMNQIPIENCSFNGNTICFYRAKMSLKLQFFPFPILIGKIMEWFRKTVNSKRHLFLFKRHLPCEMRLFLCSKRHDKLQMPASAHIYIRRKTHISEDPLEAAHPHRGIGYQSVTIVTNDN